MCTACNQRLVAVNYHRDGITHYRARCDHCIRRNKKIKPPEALWKKAGYKKKPACDKCGFKAKHSIQLLVLHADGNLNNTELRNLKTVCLNCAADLRRTDSIWRPGDLEPDV